MADQDPKTNPTTAEADDVAQATADAGAAGQRATDEPTPQPADAEPAEVLHPKERRRRTRARAQGPAAAPRSPQERQAERVGRRQDQAARRRAGRVKTRAKATARRGERPASAAPELERDAGRPNVRQGIVVSDKADKTITVRIDVVRRHRRYQKIVRTSTKLHVHDERNDAHAGDTVRVVECRPRSATKRWRLTEVLERAR